MIDLKTAKNVCKIAEQKELAIQLNLHEWAKYLDEDHFLEEKMEVFKILNLDNLTSLNVLDVGAGMGHFGSLCKHYGHNYTGTYFGRTSKQLYPFHNNANLTMKECGLFPNYDKSIPEGPWDCIVMLRTTFELNAEWNKEDWIELYDLCMSKLNPGGQLLIKSNLSVEQKRKYGALETRCQNELFAAFPNKKPLPQWQWCTLHWIKE